MRTCSLSLQHCSRAKQALHCLLWNQWAVYISHRLAGSSTVRNPSCSLSPLCLVEGVLNQGPPSIENSLKRYLEFNARKMIKICDCSGYGECSEMADLVLVTIIMMKRWSFDESLNGRDEEIVTWQPLLEFWSPLLRSSSHVMFWWPSWELRYGHVMSTLCKCS